MADLDSVADSDSVADLDSVDDLDSVADSDSVGDLQRMYACMYQSRSSLKRITEDCRKTKVNHMRNLLKCK